MQNGKWRPLPLLTADTAVLWFNFKRMLPDSRLSEYVGRNEKTKVLHCIHMMAHQEAQAPVPVTLARRHELYLRSSLRMAPVDF